MCTNLIRNDLKNFKAYASARKEAGYVDVLLNANECAWPNTLYPDLHRYPDQQPKKATELLSQFYCVEPEQLLLSRGSDEAIELLIRLFCEPGKESIILCPPTFGMYEVCATLQAIKTIEIPLLAENDFALDVEGIINAWNPKVKIVFLCSPNNPTGNLVGANTIQQLCQALKNKCIIVVDEAYVEYAREKSVSRFINTYDNLVVLRTLSKVFGLAGARCGIALSNKTLIQNLLSVMAPYPIPRMITEIIENNFQKDRLAQLYQNIEQTRLLRDQLVEQLKLFSFIDEVRSTEANFVLIKLKNPKLFLNYCESNNILLRDMSSKISLANTIRISIGSKKDTDQLLNCMRRYNEQN